MKKIVGTAALFLVLASGVCAAQHASSTRSSPLSWIATRGVMNVDDVVSALGIAPNTEQRADIKRATTRRNEQLQKINADFSRDLRQTLSANDEELAAKVQAETERRRMQLMKSRQPGRYNGVRKVEK